MKGCTNSEAKFSGPTLNFQLKSVQPIAKDDPVFVQSLAPNSFCFFNISERLLRAHCPRSGALLVLQLWICATLHQIFDYLALAILTGDMKWVLPVRIEPVKVGFERRERL